MRIQGRVVLILLSIFCLSSCVSSLWTGANLIYDRHHIYNKITDFQLQANVNRALYHDKVFKRDDVTLELAVFHRDVLLLGRVPTHALRTQVLERVENVRDKRRLFNQIEVSHRRGNPIEDSFITTQVRARILADADIDPDAFKVVTFDQLVYLMGDVMPDQAKKVVAIARSCAGVKRVVVLFQYYFLTRRQP